MTDKKDEKRIDFRYNLGLYFGLLKNYKAMFIGVLVLVLLNECFGVIEKFLFKLLIDNGTAFEAKTLPLASLNHILIIIAVIFAVVLVVKVICKWLNLHLINRLDSGIIFDLKQKFFNHLITLSHSFHVSHKTGSMISRLSRGGRAVERMTDTLIFNFAPLIFQFIVASITLVVFDYISAMVVFLTIVVFIAYNWYNQRLQEDSNVRANDTEDIEKANIGDIFTNVDSIKYFGKENFIKGKFSKLSTNTRQAFLKNWDYFRWLDSGQSLILGLGTVFLLYFSISKFLSGGLTIGTLVFIYTAYLGLMGPLYSFTHGVRDFYRITADFESLFQYNKIEQEVKDRPDAKEARIEKGEVDFKDVSFNYGKRCIFKNLNLNIKKNEKIALVGHSGCGKTTLVKLLYRFYDLDSGAVIIDGQDIRNLKQESLRSEMSVVPQECILFDDTVYNNISFSNPKATRKEVLEAIRFAQLDKIISRFPQKEETIVGERGIKLSGGEKQRVSIARAILANKKILVLDEATSSLDSETEYEIQKDFEKLMQGRTSIIIAHRLSTIMRADRIIVMKNGKIVQMGNHSKLISQPGEYKKLWNLQKGGYIK
jgi:ATP-binding cassette, subfamily B, heavy metal transporter